MYLELFALFPRDETDETEAVENTAHTYRYYIVDNDFDMGKVDRYVVYKVRVK